MSIVDPIDNAERQLSLLRKNIKKRAVAHSKKGKVILKIYNAAGKCSYKNISCCTNPYIDLCDKLKLLTKEIDKALKIKDLYSENLKKVNNFFKNALKNLKPYSKTLSEFVKFEAIKKFDEKECSATLNTMKNFTDNFDSSLNWIERYQHSEDANKFDDEYSKIFKGNNDVNTTDVDTIFEKKKNELKKIVESFLDKVFCVIKYFRYACKLYLDRKRSENKESDRVNSKSLSEALLKLKKAAEENLECSSISFIRIKNGQQKNAEVIKEVIKKEILGEINGCEKTLSLFSGGKRINSFGKYFNKSDFKKFKLALNNLKKYLNDFKMKVAQI
ncbi:MAG: hypothetical protein ACI4PR_01035 [Acutalibacteraceae bacterium]